VNVKMGNRESAEQLYSVKGLFLLANRVFKRNINFFNVGLSSSTTEVFPFPDRRGVSQQSKPHTGKRIKAQALRRGHFSYCAFV
jgi:hypothetical protein